MKPLYKTFSLPLNLLLSLSLLLSLNLNAQSGRPDSTFGTNALVITDIDNAGLEFSWATLVQPNGRILVGGYSNNGLGADYIIIRYLSNGVPDSTFGEFGIVKTDFDYSDNIYALLLMDDGRIVAAGQSSDLFSYLISMARYLPDGTIDSTFGDAGKFIFDVDGNFEQISSIALQKDGKIVGAGRISVDNNMNTEYLVVRVKDNGTLDSSFAENGIGIFSILDEDVAQSVKVLDNGKILVGGYSGVSAIGSFTMLQLNPDGSPDKFFGTAGKVITHLGGSNIGYGLVIQPDGNILLAGNANVSFFDGRSDIGVVRYKPDGSPDETFGTDGISVATSSGWNNVIAVAQQPDGKILVAGESDYKSLEDHWMLARLLPEGDLDPSFGDQGIAILDVPGTADEITSIALQKDSRIVVTGLSGTSPNYDFATGRFIADLIIHTVSTDIHCYGTDDGAIVVQASAGSGPYQYSLDGDNFQSNPLFHNLGPGSYVVYVRDVNGVTGSVGPIILADAPPPPAVTVEVSANTILVTVDSVGLFSYELDGEIFQSNGLFTDLSAEFHSLVVKDENGCIIYINDLLVWNVGVKEITPFIQFSVTPNPCKEFLYLTSMDQNLSSAVIEITDIQGRLVMQEKRQFVSNDAISINVTALGSGMYTVRVQDGEKWGVRKFVKN